MSELNQLLACFGGIKKHGFTVGNPVINHPSNQPSVGHLYHPKSCYAQFHKSLLGMIYCSCPIMIHYYTRFKPISSHEYPKKIHPFCGFVWKYHTHSIPFSSVSLLNDIKWPFQVFFSAAYTPIFWRHDTSPIPQRPSRPSCMELLPQILLSGVFANNQLVTPLALRQVFVEWEGSTNTLW